jgi:benzoyl-CoA reductase subunit C
MEAFEEFANVSSGLENSHVRDWKASGKKVVGFACSYVPEEILYAMDILPYRITGKGCSDTSHADSYLSRVNCSFSRCCLELVFDGQYDFLDGVVFVNGCDHIRRAYDNWEAHQKALPFMHILPVPHLISPEGQQWYKEEVIKLKEALEDYFDTEVTPDKLPEAVATYNETRRLLRDLYELRASDNPPFTGTEVQAILSACNTIPKTEFNGMLSDLLKEAGTRKSESNRNFRLMIAGSILDDFDLIKSVEDLGAVVVTDSLCTGARNFWDLTDEGGEAFDALVERYYNHVPCPRMFGEYSRRLGFLQDQAERARVDGAILEHIKFCDLHGTDNALLKNDLEKAGIPVIELERQYGPLADAGRIRTRIQAFLERIRR